MNRTTLLQLTGGAALIGVVSVIFFSAELTQAPTTPSHIESQETETVTITVENIYQRRTATVAADDTVLDLLKTLDTSDPNLELTTETYDEMGTLVTGMGGIKNGTGNEYWQYEINGVMPQVGADQYDLLDGDHIEWAFSASTF